MLARVATMTNDVTLRERLRLLEMKLERKSHAFDDLKKENIRLREATERRKRKDKSLERKPAFKPMYPTRSLTDLNQTPSRDETFKQKRKSSNGKLAPTQNEDGSSYDSEDAGYCSSLRSFSERGLISL